MMFQKFKRLNSDSLRFCRNSLGVISLFVCVNDTCLLFFLLYYFIQRRPELLMGEKLNQLSNALIAFNVEAHSSDFEQLSI